MNYTLKRNCPKELTFNYKVTNQTLDKEVFTPPLPLLSEHYLTTTNVNQMQIKIQELYDFLKLLISNNNYQLATFHQNINEYIATISSNLHFISAFNDSNVTDAYCATNFVLNGKNYTFNKLNQGIIEVKDYFYPGTNNDYVISYNNRYGNVNGVSGFILNEQYFWPDANGIVYFNGLISHDVDLVTTFNNVAGDIPIAVSAVSIDEAKTLQTYTEANQGCLQIQPIINGINEYYKTIYAPGFSPNLINATVETPDETNYEDQQVANIEYANNIYKKLLQVYTKEFTLYESYTETILESETEGMFNFLHLYEKVSSNSNDKYYRPLRINKDYGLTITQTKTSIIISRTEGTSDPISCKITYLTGSILS